jgi:C4-dicarboxylate-binding protein DctP
MKGPVGKWLFQKLEAKGITGLAYWDNGFHRTSANRPLLMPTDFQGLKIRISGSKIADRYFRDVGSIPQIMAFSEVYQALQTGVVDGQENTPSNMYTQKMHEVQKYTTLSDHGYIGYVVVVNKKFWDGLPGDVRGSLERAMAEATKYSNEISQTENDEALEEMKKSGRTQFVTLTGEQKARWKKALTPLYTDMASRVGKGLIEEVEQAVKATGTN